jgi:hypothetical protein
MVEALEEMVLEFLTTLNLRNDRWLLITIDLMRMQDQVALEVEHL